MIILLNHFKADSTDKRVLRKVTQRSRPDNPDKYHNLLFEADYGNGCLLEWADDGFWTTPLHDPSPEADLKQKNNAVRKNLSSND